MRFTFPDVAGFTIDDAPSCYAVTDSEYTIPGTLWCEQEGTNQVVMWGLEGSIEASSEVGININVKNPRTPKKQTTSIQRLLGRALRLYMTKEMTFPESINPGSIDYI